MNDIINIWTNVGRVLKKKTNQSFKLFFIFKIALGDTLCETLLINFQFTIENWSSCNRKNESLPRY
jgi:hypothetical protein